MKPALLFLAPPFWLAGEGSTPSMCRVPSWGLTTARPNSLGESGQNSHGGSTKGEGCTRPHDPSPLLRNPPPRRFQGPAEEATGFPGDLSWDTYNGQLPPPPQYALILGEVAPPPTRCQPPAKRALPPPVAHAVLDAQARGGGARWLAAGEPRGFPGRGGQAGAFPRAGRALRLAVERGQPPPSLQWRAGGGGGQRHALEPQRQPPVGARK